MFDNKNNHNISNSRNFCAIHSNICAGNNASNESKKNNAPSNESKKINKMRTYQNKVVMDICSLNNYPFYERHLSKEEQNLIEGALAKHFIFKDLDQEKM